MSYDAEHLGYWYGNNIVINSATTTHVTFSDGVNTNTTAPTGYRWNLSAVYYEIVTSTNALATVQETGASNNTFCTIGGTGSATTNGYRKIKFPGRGMPSANSARGIDIVTTGTLLMNFVVIATLEKIA